MKKLSYIKLYRPEFDRLTKNLSERETTLFLALVIHAGWDPRHKDHYSKVNKTLREIQQEYLPKWSLGKVHSVITVLKDKGFIEVTNKRTFLVNYLWLYTATQKTIQMILSNPEHSVHLPKQIFQNSEQSVRTGEQLNLRKQINGLAESKRLPRGP
jgi:predicted transcriptional regulator